MEFPEPLCHALPMPLRNNKGQRRIRSMGGIRLEVVNTVDRVAEAFAESQGTQA